MIDTIIKRILNARIYGLARETPVDHAALLSERLGHNVLLKREDLQPVFSFKIRGAYNKLQQLSKEECQQGVVAASAGNHAQGLALAARHLNITAHIVMPKTTPQIKVDAVKRYGAKVILHGDTFDEAAAHARVLVEDKSLIFIPPYDDLDVIAGQGTVAVELLRQHTSQINAVFIPVGGGGLCAGMTSYIKFLRPDIKVFGVEPEDAACLKAALDKDKRVTLKQVGLFADGVAVAQIGKRPFDLLKDRIDGVITVSADEMCAAIKDIFEDTRSIAEPAGALALAGLKKYCEDPQGKNGKPEGVETLVAVLSGANTNFDRLRYISERTEIGEKREVILGVSIPEKPGSYRQFCRLLGRRNITEFNYRYAQAKEAHIFVGMQISPEKEDRQELISHIQSRGYEVCDLTDNEMAKLHIRHMVGGRAPEGMGKELVYRFEFPERPGALMAFLSILASSWNISFFHYRNHGAAYGRVLVGLQVPDSELADLESRFDSLNYRYWNESANEAYQLFLA